MNKMHPPRNALIVTTVVLLVVGAALPILVQQNAYPHGERIFSNGKPLFRAGGPRVRLSGYRRADRDQQLRHRRGDVDSACRLERFPRQVTGS